MYASDYRKELALKSERPVPALIAFVLIAVIGVSVWYGYQTLKPRFQATEDPAASTE